MHYRLLKSELNVYPQSQLVTDGLGVWDGVRSYQARNNLAAIKVGDLCLFYDSNIGKEVVGICQVTREHYPDPTADDPRRVVVEITSLERTCISCDPRADQVRSNSQRYLTPSPFTPQSRSRHRAGVGVL